MSGQTGPAGESSLTVRPHASTGELHRFDFTERVVHWVVGLTFLYLLLTGLAFSYPSLFWLTALSGGGPAARALHPWVGLVFTVGAVAMFALWVRDMKLDAHDGTWLRSVRAYALREKDQVPPAGKYNGGQKVFFWAQSVLALVFLITGAPLWTPAGVLGVDAVGRGAFTAFRLVHYLAALGGGLFLVAHVYLGTVAYPGTLRGMLQGTVTRAWARLHHPLWEREETGP